MQCKQCSGTNEERAIECGWCGAGLRRPYPCDALGQWLERLEPEVVVSSTAWTVFVVLVCLVVVAPFALVGFDFVDGWIPAIAIVLGLVATVLGLSGLFAGRSIAKGRARFRSKVRPALEELYRETDMQRWRVGVLVHESLPRRSAISTHFIAGELPDGAED